MISSGYPSGAQRGLVQYRKLEDRPQASDFGVGKCQIDENFYYSNGTTWSVLGKNTQITGDTFGRTTGLPYPVNNTPTYVDLSLATRTFTGGAADSPPDTIYLNSKNNVKFTYNAAGMVVDFTAFSTALDLSAVKSFILDFYRPKLGSNVDGVCGLIYLCNTAADFTNTATCYFNIAANGKTRINFNLGCFTKAGTFSFASAIAQIRIRIYHTTAKELPALTNSASDYVLLGGMELNPRTRAKILFTFDDFYEAVPLLWKPLLDQYNFKATAYVVPPIIGTGNKTTLAEMQMLKSAGWTIGNHTWSHPGDAASTNGIVRLGPKGLSIPIVSWVSGNNFITTSSGNAPAGYAAPIVFAGAVPSNINVGQLYYPRNISSTTFSVHPTLLDSINGTNAITASSTAGTITYSYSDATTDYTGIMNDIIKCRDWLNANGFDGAHLALPQGGADLYVDQALKNLNMKTVRMAFQADSITTPDTTKNILQLPGTQTALNTINVNGGYAPSSSWANLSVTQASDNATLITQVSDAIDYAVNTGGTLCLLHHGYTDAEAKACVAYVAKYVAAGLCDVVTVDDWYNGQF